MNFEMASESAAAFAFILPPQPTLIALRKYFFMNRQRLFSSDISAHAIPASIAGFHIPVEEERKDDYDPKHFYPELGEVFDKAYQVITKLGYGGSSTV
jgi:hypothetical protein